MTKTWLLLGALFLVACSSGTAEGERPVTDFNGVPIGATCAVDADCGGAKDSCCKGGKCSPQGWCSPKCVSDQDCPEGFFCVDHEGSRCFAACGNDRDCPIGFVCEEKNNHLACSYK